MDSANLKIDGVRVLIEGNGPGTILMLHGWPDSEHLWDGTVAALREEYRCVRLTLPGFDLSHSSRPTSVADMSDLLHKVVQAVSPTEPITLLIHDWGCVFGYEFAARQPAQVKRIVAVDIGDHNSGAYLRSLETKEKLGIFGYQVWLAFAWAIGSRISAKLGNVMTRFMARSVRCPAPSDSIAWQMNYPYAMQWFGSFGGLRGLARVKPQCPTLFIYGQRKPFMFHSAKWIETLHNTRGCKAVGLRAGHWVMLDRPDEFHATVHDWLKTV